VKSDQTKMRNSHPIEAPLSWENEFNNSPPQKGNSSSSF